MIKKHKILRIVYPDIQLYNRDAAKLRGFFANKHMDESVFHNHTSSGFMYEYPKIQYKVIHGKPMILAFGKGINAVYGSVLEEDEIDINGRTINVTGIKIGLYDETTGDSARMYAYKFLTPWLGLNQRNYKTYKDMEDEDASRQLLEKVLIGNVLSMCKGMDIQLDNRIIVKSSLKEIPLNFKNETMLGFYGGFSVNCRLPSYFGIGKSVSRGFGTIKKVKNHDNSSETAGEGYVQRV